MPRAGPGGLRVWSRGTSCNRPTSWGLGSRSCLQAPGANLRPAGPPPRAGGPARGAGGTLPARRGGDQRRQVRKETSLSVGSGWRSDRWSVPRVAAVRRPCLSQPTMGRAAAPGFRALSMSSRRWRRVEGRGRGMGPNCECVALLYEACESASLSQARPGTRPPAPRRVGAAALRPTHRRCRRGSPGGARHRPGGTRRIRVCARHGGVACCPAPGKRPDHNP